MGLNHSKQPLLHSDEDPNKYNNPSPLPPNPPEVDVHCNTHKCCLTLQTINLPSNDCKGNSKLPKIREYIIHEPEDLKKRKVDETAKATDLLPLVLCLHGTDETITDTELVAQEDSKTLWLDLSHTQNFIVVFPQSLRYKAKENIPMSWRPLGDDIRTCWQPDHDDELFISCLFDQLLESYHIDKSKVYCVGYSNGGLFLTSLLLSHGLDKSCL